MAYENINVSKLKGALKTIDNIDYENVNNLCNKLVDEQWQSPIKNRIKTALEEIVTEIKIIQNEIEIYKTASDFIKSYQESSYDYDMYAEKAREAKQKYDRYRYKNNPDANDEYWRRYYWNKYDEYMSKQSRAQDSKNNTKNKIDSLIN